jgi:hypothetical protein
MKRLVACAIAVLVALSLAECGGGGDEGGGPKAPNDVKPASAKEAAITEFKKRDDSQKVDKIGGADGQLAPDGKMDAAFDATIRGPLIGLLVDSEGDSAWQWDTYVGTQEVPAQMKALAPKGMMTGGLGVFENGNPLNKPDGSLTITDDAEHHVVIFISDTGAFIPGASFKLLGETPDHKVIEGPVAKY